MLAFQYKTEFTKHKNKALEVMNREVGEFAGINCSDHISRYASRVELQISL